MRKGNQRECNMGMKSIIMAGVFIYQNFENERKSNQNAWKSRIKKQWIESANYPRKKKKQTRKYLMLEWRIASWEPDYNF